MVQSENRKSIVIRGTVLLCLRDEKMGYNPITPFRRMVDAAHLERRKIVEAELPPQGVNKWEALRELSVARVTFGLSDRDMAVLQALLSFHSETIIGGNSRDLVVHPSNRAICERMNGIPGSTMRRHLGNLVLAGVLVRRDSPNGKRYTRRSSDGKEAFGFDLTPIVVRFEEFCGAAEAVRAEQERFQRLRETVSLMRRDLASLSAYGEEIRPDLSIWDRLNDLAALTARALKRKLELEDIQQIEAGLLQALNEARSVIEPTDSEEMSSNEAQNEQHYQNSNTELHDLELRTENAKAPAVQHLLSADGKLVAADEDPSALPFENAKLPNLPLGLVLSTCSEIAMYADGQIKHWHGLVRAAEIVRPMMGISPSAWGEAKGILGPEEAAVVLAAMLQRFSEIRSPGGYLRMLTNKAAAGTFSSGPMIMALMRKEAA